MTLILLLAVTLCIELAMNLPMGSLPLLLDQEHVARDHITLAMGAGMLTSVLVSIPIGAYVDRVGRILMMRIGIIGALISLIILSTTHGALPAAMIMSMRTIFMVTFMTAMAAYVSMIVPEERSVSAVSLMGVTGNLAFAIAPATAVWLWQHGFGRMQFLGGAAVLAVGAFLLLNLPKEREGADKASEKKRLVFMRKEWLPAIGFAMAGALQAGVNCSLAVLAFHERGIANGAVLFTASALTTVFFRYHAGRAVETVGPRKMAVPTALLQSAGCVLAAGAHSITTVTLAGICFGIGWAAVVPVVLGLFFEEASSEYRGAAMGAFHFAFGTGAALGAGVATLCSMYGNGYMHAISICACAPLFSLPFLWITHKAISPAGNPIPIAGVIDPTE